MKQSTEDLQAKADGLKNSAIERKANELATKHSKGQLALWPESERGIPNEFVRCAVFSAKNKKEKREVYIAKNPKVVPIIGGGKVLYIGEELRQDDETVWMQLVQISKESRTEWIEFTPYSFVKSVGWTICGASYERLLTSIRRLSAAGIEVYSQRFDRGLKTQLIRSYEYSEGSDRPWRVKMFDKDDPLLFMFEKLYSRLDWQTRLTLPDGIATWLHGFYASHKDPFHHKIETLANGAGLKLEHSGDGALEDAQRLRARKKRLVEAKRTIVRGLQALKDAGFLADFEVSRAGVVKVRRNT